MSLPETGAHGRSLLLVCAAAAAGGFLFGFDQIVISGTVDAVRARYGLHAGLEGLFVSAALIGAMVGAAAAGWLTDALGRRFNLLLAGGLTLFAALAAALAPDAALLIAARMVGGLGVGVASMVCPLYIAEIAPSASRGRLVTLFQFAITLGILIALISNALLAARFAAPPGGAQVELWRLMLATQAVPSLAFLALSWPLPESPRWLARAGRADEALAILGRFAPLAEARAALAEVAVDAAPKGALGRLLSEDRRALGLALALAVFSELSGITVVFYYGPSILSRAGFAFGGALSGIVSIGAVNMLATLIALTLIDRVGRRALLLTGTAGAVACLVGITLTIGAGAGPRLVALICGFVICFAFGIGPIKFVVVQELFPTATRGVGAAALTVAVWGAGALVNQVFPTIRDTWGAAASFGLFAGVLALQIPFAILLLPETAGRSIEGGPDGW
ncbi:sugar porter family MFS transporter [Phenylobacterium sp.]|uniref:sugar porter family MFS transporter n=1 Tax=Phenylobacterium sp. TaxID=1871053 RepID=UPI003565B5D0